MHAPGNFAPCLGPSEAGFRSQNLDQFGLNIGGAKESGGLTSVDVRGLVDAISIAFDRCFLRFNNLLHDRHRLRCTCPRAYAPIVHSHMIPIMRQACLVAGPVEAPGQI